MLFTTALCLLSALAPIVVGADLPRLTKPYVTPGFEPQVFLDKITAVLKPMKSHHDTWGKGWVPIACKDLTTWQKYDPRDVEAFNIYYDDCPTSWVFCRHKDSPMSQDRIIDLFGRLPVHYREEVRHIVFLPRIPTPPYKMGLSWGDNIALWGDADIRLIMHEVGHNVDRGYGPSGGVLGQPAYSFTDPWRTEYEKDKCCSDFYGQTNHVENFAQIISLALYDKVVPGGLGGLLPQGWPDIFHQYATAQWKLGNVLIPGGTCVRRWKNDEAVWVGVRARRSRPDLVDERAPKKPLPDQAQAHGHSSNLIGGLCGGSMNATLAASLNLNMTGTASHKHNRNG